MTTDTIVQLDFSDALKAMRQGKRVRWLQWYDASDHWLELHPATETTKERIEHCCVSREPSLWLPTPGEILATDWVVVEDVDVLDKLGV